MLGPGERQGRNRKIKLCSESGAVCVCKETEGLPVCVAQECSGSLNS